MNIKVVFTTQPDDAEVTIELDDYDCNSFKKKLIAEMVSGVLLPKPEEDDDLGPSSCACPLCLPLEEQEAFADAKPCACWVCLAARTGVTCQSKPAEVSHAICDGSGKFCK